MFQLILYLGMDRKLRHSCRFTDLSKRWAGWQHQLRHLQTRARMLMAKQMLVV